jgi:isopentenyl phosphate kinase
VHGLTSLQDTVYVKLGGSFITIKDKPVTLRRESLNAVAEILRQVYGRVRLILGNGGGSFAHYAVRKYCGDSRVDCVVKCHQATRLLNRIITDHLVEAGIPASSIQTSAVITVSQGGEFKVFPDPVYNFISAGLIPLLYGECIPCSNGYHVVSTEKVFELLAESIKPARIVLLTDVKGVYTCNPSRCSDPVLIKSINKNNISQVLEQLSREKNSDATGGIYSKVKSMYELSERLGVRVIIVSGFSKQDAVNAILHGEISEGTIIEP